MKRPYAAGHFELQIDGHPTSAYLKSVDGGMLKGSVIDEAHGSDGVRLKHLSMVEVEPFTIECGLAGSGQILKWIQQSWKKEFSRRNGQITHANFDMKGTYEHEFIDALIVETAFPALDGASRDAAYMKVKIQPERVVARKGSGARLHSILSDKQKMWLPNAFRLDIEGLEDVKYVNKIEAFTIKQGVKKLHTGESRYAQIEPTKIEFPSLTCTMALDYADRVLEWHEKYIRVGHADPKAQKVGTLEFLTPDRRDTIFSISLFGLGLPNLQILQSSANVDQIKRLKFELFVERMELDVGARGFD
ncbi:MAG: phage tail protein [Kofleriaceae bacterium]|nr:phage tail protein [Kofleriaceae bacterium]